MDGLTILGVVSAHNPYRLTRRLGCHYADLSQDLHSSILDGVGLQIVCTNYTKKSKAIYRESVDQLYVLALLPLDSKPEHVLLWMMQAGMHCSA